MEIESHSRVILYLTRKISFKWFTRYILFQITQYFNQAINQLQSYHIKSFIPYPTSHFIRLFCIFRYISLIPFYFNIVNLVRTLVQRILHSHFKRITIWQLVFLITDIILHVRDVHTHTNYIRVMKVWSSRKKHSNLIS